MQYSILLIILALLTGCASTPSRGSISDLNARLKRSLDATGLKYKELSNGNIRLHFTLNNGRTHLVFIEGFTKRFGRMDFRSIWALGWKGETQPSSEVAGRLLLDSSMKKIGAWELYKQSDGEGSYFAAFNVKIPSPCDSRTLNEIVWAVATTADSMEERLLSTDSL